MRKSRVISIGMIILSLSAGCSKRPDGVLSERKMVDVMADMQIARAMTETSPESGIGDEILRSHGVTRQEMDCTLNWYGHNMDKYADLYAKVDKELLKRKKKLGADVTREKEESGSDLNLWPFSEKTILSPDASNFALVLSLENPELKKGDIVEWKFRINSVAVSTISVLGAEYSDGTVNYVIRRNSGKRNILTELQTDSSKKVSRLFGTFRTARSNDMPIWIDSIALLRQPYDSLNYYKINHQTNYNGPSKRRNPIKTDTLKGVKKTTGGTTEILRNQTINVSPVNSMKDPTRKMSSKGIRTNMTGRKR